MSGLCGKLFVFKAKLKSENQKMMGGMWVVNAKDAERARSFRKGSLPGTGSFKLQRSIATSRQRTGQDDRLAAAGVLTLRGGVTCLTPSRCADTTRGSYVCDTLEVC